MSRPTESHAESAPAPAVARKVLTTLELEEELQRAEQDFERGDYIELSRDQLERCIQTGESPCPDESRD